MQWNDHRSYFYIKVCIITNHFVFTVFYNDFNGTIGGRWEARNLFGFLFFRSLLVSSYSSACLMSSISTFDIFLLGAFSVGSLFFYSEPQVFSLVSTLSLFLA